MIDLATVPIEVYCDWLEEAGENTTELRCWMSLFPPFGALDCWFLDFEEGVPVGGCHDYGTRGEGYWYTPAGLGIPNLEQEETGNSHYGF